MSVVEVKDLSKTYKGALDRKPVEALRSVSFCVESGEIYGFLGPNGAGKTTTIRILMGLIRPSSGRAKLFDHELPSREARQDIGFLPESPYFYEYLTLDELLDFTGRMFGLSRAERLRRADKLVERVGMEHARRARLKSYSKGMLQRAGIAQALINDPKLVVFDEPMGGLDPIGRKDVRDIIFSLKDEGKTVFFSSHILADVEVIADRVAILVKGKVEETGTLRAIVGQQITSNDISFRWGDSVEDSAVSELCSRGELLVRKEQEMSLSVSGDNDVNELVGSAMSKGFELVSVIPHHATLEDVFIRAAKKSAAKETAISRGKE